MSSSEHALNRFSQNDSVLESQNVKSLNTKIQVKILPRLLVVLTAAWLSLSTPALASGAETQQPSCQTTVAKAALGKDYENSLRVQFLNVREHVQTRVIGQKEMVEGVLLAKLAGGHILVQGQPGAGKTTLFKAFASAMSVTTGRIQGHPEISADDIVGFERYDVASQKYEVTKGPIFSDLVLVDEINRIPPKLQASLLSAMGEGVAKIGHDDLELPEGSVIVATQNPYDNNGTFPLTDANMDRFLLMIDAPRASREELGDILKLVAAQGVSSAEASQKPLSKEALLEIQKLVKAVPVSQEAEALILDIIEISENPKLFKVDDAIAKVIRPFNPRAAISLMKAGQAHAWLNGNSSVTAQDIQAVAVMSLRPRIQLSNSANVESVTPAQIITAIVEAAVKTESDRR